MAARGREGGGGGEADWRVSDGRKDDEEDGVRRRMRDVPRRWGSLMKQ